MISFSDAAKNIPKTNSDANCVKEAKFATNAPVRRRMSQTKFVMEETIARRRTVPRGFGRRMTASKQTAKRLMTQTTRMADVVNIGSAVENSPGRPASRIDDVRSKVKALEVEGSLNRCLYLL